MKAAQKVCIILALVGITLIGDSKGVSCDISTNGSSPTGLIMNYEAGTNLSITCSCSNPDHFTILWEVNLQNYTEESGGRSGSVTIHRIISHPVSFICCQHHTDTNTYRCTRPLHINLMQQEELIQEPSSSSPVLCTSQINSPSLPPSLSPSSFPSPFTSSPSLSSSPTPLQPPTTSPTITPSITNEDTSTTNEDTSTVSTDNQPTACTTTVTEFISAPVSPTPSMTTVIVQPSVTTNTFGSCFTTDNGFGVVVIIAIITIIVELVACIAVTLCCQHQKSKLKRNYKGPCNNNNDTIENSQHT